MTNYLWIGAVQAGGLWVGAVQPASAAPGGSILPLVARDMANIADMQNTRG